MTAPVLEVSSSAHETFVFPYQHLLSAHHIRALLAMRRSSWLLETHEVVISGRRLGEILAALQDLAVEEISAVPPRYREVLQRRMSLGDPRLRSRLSNRLCKPKVLFLRRHSVFNCHFLPKNGKLSA